MTILEFKRHFKQELSNLYSESESAQLYSIFVEKIVGLSSFHQRRFMHQELLIDDEQRLSEALNELTTGKPYQQILGETEFYGLTFFVDENVLIPRPETEELLEITIQKIRSLSVQSPRILDIGTGSGIIPIILKKYFPEADVSSIDFSEMALKTAQRNANLHQVKVNFIHADYLNFKLEENYDIIISNPPYIGIEEEIEIADSVKEFEPRIALFSPTADALIFYRKIAKDAEQHLNNNGWIFLEINQKLGEETLSLFVNNHFKNASLIKDISENNRFVIVKK